MRVRRCAALLMEPRESIEFDLAQLLVGESGLVPRLQWYALAAHLGEPVDISPEECLALGAIGKTAWEERASLDERFGGALVERLLACGLLVSDQPPPGTHSAHEAKLRDTYWQPLSAVAHAFSRWTGVDADEASERTGMRTVRDMVERLGTPPSHSHAVSAAAKRIPLAPAHRSALDDLLDRRVTCRNFDALRPVPLPLMSSLLQRVFGARGSIEPAPGATVVKKTSPSGGGLHATEAYLLVRNVEGLAAGLYHYHAADHALEPIDLASAETVGEHALRFVAGQHWFAGAPVQVILAPRFRRSFWKYRNHAKAYRALILDAGHLSQTLYLTATEFGMGAFITSAINEIEIERAFGLDPLEEGPLAVCGFGWRGDLRDTVEFDPLHAVWPAAAEGDAG